MYNCTFELNDQPLSTLKVAGTSFPAFSGLDPHVNRRVSACIAGVGPIPPGRYYIWDRQSGGLLGSVYDMFGQRSEWFSLYAIDGKIDDETFCQEVKRGNFRLHPKVGRGISKGCITIDSQAQFNRLRALLKTAKQQAVPGSVLLAYGTVEVK